MAKRRKPQLRVYRASWAAKVGAETIEDSVGVVMNLIAQEGIRLSIQITDTDGRYSEVDTVDISAAALIAGLQTPPTVGLNAAGVQLRPHIDRFMTDAGQAVLRDLLVKW